MRTTRQLERTKEVLKLAAEPRCYKCQGVADRIIAGRRGGPCLADCRKCRDGGMVSGRRKAAK